MLKVYQRKGEEQGANLSVNKINAGKCWKGRKAEDVWAISHSLKQGS
jgi:hypothetical protein